MPSPPIAVKSKQKPDFDKQKPDSSLPPPAAAAAAVNSCRMSIKIKQADELEEMLCDKLTSFLNQRAESFLILRRKAVEGGFYILLFIWGSEGGGWGWSCA